MASAHAAAGSVPTTPDTVWPLVLSGAVNVLIAIVILIVGWLLSRWVYRLIHEALERARFVDPTLKPLTAATVRYGIIAITLVAVLQQFGVQTTSLIAVLGAAGLALGLALQGTLSNVASGVMLLALRPLRSGENVLVGGIGGNVREVGLFRTILISANGDYISMPNTAIFGDTIINQSRLPTRRIEFKVTIDGIADIEKARQFALDVLLADKRVLKTPLPAVTVDSLSDTAVKLSVQAWTPTVTYGSALSDLQRMVRRHLADAGIAPPQQLVHFVGSGDHPLSPGGDEVRSTRTN